MIFTSFHTLVIGAGIVGCSIAHSLAERGIKDIAILERERVGSGSTSASLGGFRHQFMEPIFVEMTKEGVKFLEKLPEIAQINPFIKKDGYVLLASTQQTKQALKQMLVMLKGLGVKAEWLESETLSQMFPFYRFDEVLGGTFCAEDGHALTSSLLQAYLKRSKEFGVKLFEHTEVTALLTQNGRVKGVLTNRGEFQAKNVVIACGAYSGELGKRFGIEIPVYPVPRKVIVVKGAESIPRNIPLIVDLDLKLAVGIEGNGVLIALNESPSEATFECKFDFGYDEKTIHLALLRIPALFDAKVLYSVCGLYEMTPDTYPIISSIPPYEGLFCCAGFCGHGFMHSRAAGELMAELITGSRPHLDIKKFCIERFTHPSETRKDIVI